MPKTWLQVAIERGAKEDPEGNLSQEEFERVGILILNGCPSCHATVAPYNSYQMPNSDYAWCRYCAGVEN